MDNPLALLACYFLLDIVSSEVNLPFTEETFSELTGFLEEAELLDEDLLLDEDGLLELGLLLEDGLLELDLLSDEIGLLELELELELLLDEAGSMEVSETTLLDVSACLTGNLRCCAGVFI
ncbi:MAG: hypothetical protein K0R90_877 [Oscillospiraceae bacterium]|jgi:hypothetical protein|nr:hypothetical protein [Oscillospiraceae bacterium]